VPVKPDSLVAGIVKMKSNARGEGGRDALLLDRNKEFERDVNRRSLTRQNERHE
jgi:hypothetical protein